MNKQVRIVVITALVTLLIVAMMQNMRPVALRFIVWQAVIPLSLLLPCVFVGGAIAGWFYRRR